MRALTRAVLTASNGARDATGGNLLQKLHASVIGGDVPYVNCAFTESCAHHHGLVLVEPKEHDAR